MELTEAWDDFETYFLIPLSSYYSAEDEQAYIAPLRDVILKASIQLGSKPKYNSADIMEWIGELVDGETNGGQDVDAILLKLAKSIQDVKKHLDGR